ncbi:YhfC family intramembrane metalloprotease [Propioniciclava sinopodophylli]|uniref:YhfC family intramembrane metalloprotease n=1 Tax=Propioniciclava sinopodophylli TaxID=1837344 RepID=A0A4Q9KBE3_9ACTN|nr:YhfC family glutamic-type intramembrane protease [Propioniciclava sinopodophylli]TBT83114.1 YhfC family intramembrane metalloprotease [Propioniciclava sinopodophylli]
MVSPASLAFMALTTFICLAVPLGGMLWIWSRRTPEGSQRWPHVWRSFWAGALAFVIAQVLTRLPLMTLVVPQLPEPWSGILLSGPGASYLAGLFEETGRLLLMLWLMKALHRWIDGVSFGLGHGGIEAVLLVGTANVNNMVIAGIINAGGWDAVAQSLPPEAAEQLRSALVDTSPWMFLLGGVERLAAITLHIACSLLVLAGIVHGRKLAGWAAAVVLHGSFNLVAVGMLQAGVHVLAVEALLIALAAALWLGILNSKRWFEPDRDSEVAPAPGIA